MINVSKKFLAAVVAPTALVGLYFGFIATPVYRSTASVMTMNPSKESGGISSMLTGGTGDSMTGAFLTKEFVESWSEYKQLDQRLSLRKLWGNGDPITSYIKFVSGDVSLYNYYKRNVKATIDKKSGIVTLESYAHSAKDAASLNAQLVADTEAQINRLNTQKAIDTTRLAQSQLDIARKAVDEDNAAIAAFRKKTGFYKPDLDYQATLVAQSAIGSNLASAQADYQGVNGSTPNNPAIDGMKDRIASYRKDTSALSAKGSAINAVAKQYDALESKRQLDIAMLQKAGQLVQDAAVKSAADHYYLTVISAPSAPSDPEFPRAILNTFIAFCLFLVVYKFILAPRL